VLEQGKQAGFPTCITQLGIDTEVFILQQIQKAAEK
jgi:hypothetical protein